MTITFSDGQTEIIGKITKIEGKAFADIVRGLCDEAIKIQVSNENIDLVTDIIEQRLRAILKPQIERLASISAKGAIMSPTSTFLNAQALADFVPVERRRDLVETYEKARLKGVEYVRGRTNDYEMEVKEEYKER